MKDAKLAVEGVKSGKVRYIGASSMWAYQFAMMQFVAEKNGWTKFVSMQANLLMLSIPDCYFYGKRLCWMVS